MKKAIVEQKDISPGGQLSYVLTLGVSFTGEIVTMAKGKTHVFQSIFQPATRAVKKNHKVLDALYERARTCPICSALRRRFGFDARCALHRTGMWKKLPRRFGLR